MNPNSKFLTDLSIMLRRGDPINVIAASLAHNKATGDYEGLNEDVWRDNFRFHGIEKPNGPCK